MLTVSEAMNFVKNNKKVAIVGLSPKQDRPSFQVAQFLISKGFEVTPINPGYDEILGIPCLKDLSALTPGQVDWIDLFVSPQRLMGLLPEIQTLKPKLVWCQIGVVDKEFNQALESSHIPYIADVCPKQEWS